MFSPLKQQLQSNFKVFGYGVSIVYFMLGAVVINIKLFTQWPLNEALPVAVLCDVLLVYFLKKCFSGLVLKCKKGALNDEN
jgi:hypothetical protein